MILMANKYSDQPFMEDVQACHLIFTVPKEWI